MGNLRPIEDRFWEKVTKTDDCWIWTGSTAKGGYGQIWWNGRLQRAPRVAYELTFGRRVPEELDIDHLCRRPSCVRPEHLEAVTTSENIRRGLLVALRPIQTHCVHGHELTKANTRRWRSQLICKTCKAQWTRRYRATLKQKEGAVWSED